MAPQQGRSYLESKGTGLGFCFYRVKCGGTRVSKSHSLLMNSKHKSENLKCGKRIKQVAQMISYGNQSRSKAMKPSFEVDAS